MSFEFKSIIKSTPDRSSKRNEVIGQVYNELTIISFNKNYKEQNYYNCLCSCGKTTIVRIAHLKIGRIKSCGCKRVKIIHGMTNTKTYTSWEAMKQRCNNPNHHKYKDYGGRGITICKEWLDFNNFFKDMGVRPDNTTIDRIEVNGNYNKENCRWATPSQQRTNQRK